MKMVTNVNLAKIALSWCAEGFTDSVLVGTLLYCPSAKPMRSTVAQ